MFKDWIGKKILSANKLFGKDLEKKFSYIYRYEYLNNCSLNSNVSGVSNIKYCDSEVIVSLTTYGNRLYEVYLAIESIMQQSLKSNRIVLWLSDELKDCTLPIVLQKQQRRGLDIRYCKDIRAYTKLIYSLKEFPNEIIITIDDDHLYYFDLIEVLVNSYKTNSNFIYSQDILNMKLMSHDKLEKYSKWKKVNNNTPSHFNFPRGVGGVLYPPNCFNNEVFNENVFLDICKYADDIWFKAMALFNGTMAQRIFTHNKNDIDCLTNKASEHSTLNHINKNMNDIQLKSVFDKYKLYEKLI